MTVEFAELFVYSPSHSVRGGLMFSIFVESRRIKSSISQLRIPETSSVPPSTQSSADPFTVWSQVSRYASVQNEIDNGELAA